MNSRIVLKKFFLKKKIFDVTLQISTSANIFRP